jgi:Mrr N-terminal domain
VDLPDTEPLILPILQMLSQRPLTSVELQDGIAEQFGLTKEQRLQRFPNPKANQTMFENRIAFALKELQQAELILPAQSSKAPREITSRGRDVVSNPPETITYKFLRDFRGSNEKSAETKENNLPVSPDPGIVKAPLSPEKPSATPTTTDPPEPTMLEPTNLILYGPPGTGKTFETAVEAVRLCGKVVSKDRPELKRSYDMLVEAGQIAFVTFHQNYSYEDFVEGLRPTTGTEESDDRSGFRLTPRRGIFREISALAEQARKTSGHTGGFEIGDRQVFKMSLGRAGVEDHIFDAAITGNYIGLGWGGDIDWSDPRYDGDAGYNAIRDHWRKVDPEKKGSSSDISQLWPFRSLMREGDLVVVSWGNSHFRAIGQITGP